MGDYADDAIERGMWEEEHADELEDGRIEDTTNYCVDRVSSTHKKKSEQQNLVIGPPNCPACGKKMALRTNKQNNSNFYGCSTYPQCKQTAKYIGPKVVQEKSYTQKQYENSCDFTKLLRSPNFDEFKKNFISCFDGEDYKVIEQNIKELYIILADKQDNIPF